MYFFSISCRWVVKMPIYRLSIFFLIISPTPTVGRGVSEFIQIESLSISSFSLHFLLTFSFSLFFLAARLPGYHNLMYSSAISSELFLLMIQRLSLLDCRHSDWHKSVILVLTIDNNLQSLTDCKSRPSSSINHKPNLQVEKEGRRRRRVIRNTSTDWRKTGQSQVHRQHLTECNICQPPPPTSHREVTFPCTCRCKVGTKRVQKWNW